MNDESSKFPSHGYSYDFVNTPPHDVVCGICCLPSRIPQLSECCGGVFCRECLYERLRQKAKLHNCPICQDKRFRTVNDKRSDRAVRRLHIYCTNKNKGCQWQGEINNVTDHICNSCDFEEMKCTNDCGEIMERRYIIKHSKAECPFREATCQYCHITDKYQFIEGEHVQECLELPLPCPNKCGIQIICRKDMKAHREICPNEMIKCEYNNIGCNTEMVRKDVGYHNKLKEQTHISLRLTATEQKLASINSRLISSQNNITYTEVHVSNLEMMVYQLMRNNNSKGSIDRQIANWSIYLTTAALESSTEPQACPVILKMPMNKSWSSSILPMQWYSNPFFSYCDGYKMCLYVDASGTGKGNGTHISVALHTVKSSNDYKLTWPLRQMAFEISLLNQQSDSCHCSAIIYFDYHTPCQIGCRVTKGETSEEGWGYECFVSNEDLNKTTPMVQFLKDDCVFFQIKTVK